MTLAQLATNTATIAGSTYGQTITLTVGQANQAAFATSLNMLVTNDASANNGSVATKEAGSGDAVFAGTAITTFGSLKSTVLGAVKGSTDATLTSDALGKDLQSVNADTVYLVLATTSGATRFVQPAQLNSNGTIKFDLFDNSTTFTVVKASLSRDQIFATAPVASNGQGGIGAYVLNPNETTWTKAADGNNYYGVSRQLSLNYQVNKSNSFGMTQNGSASNMNFKQLYDAHIN